MFEPYHFLARCTSKPLTLGDLKPGDLFVLFPSDGDDSGHGGFRGGSYLFVRQEEVRHLKGLDCKICLCTCVRYDRPDHKTEISLSCPVIKIAANLPSGTDLTARIAHQIDGMTNEA